MITTPSPERATTIPSVHEISFASSDPWERFGWGRFTLVLLVPGVPLARSSLPPGQPADRR